MPGQADRRRPAAARRRRAIAYDAMRRRSGTGVELLARAMIVLAHRSGTAFRHRADAAAARPTTRAPGRASLYRGQVEGRPPVLQGRSLPRRHQQGAGRPFHFGGQRRSLTCEKLDPSSRSPEHRVVRHGAPAPGFRSVDRRRSCPGTALGSGAAQDMAAGGIELPRDPAAWRRPLKTTCDALERELDGGRLLARPCGPVARSPVLPTRCWPRSGPHGRRRCSRDQPLGWRRRRRRWSRDRSYREQSAPCRPTTPVTRRVEHAARSALTAGTPENSWR